MDLDINPLDHAPLLCNDSSSQQQIPALRAGCRTFSTRTMVAPSGLWTLPPESGGMSHELREECRDKSSARVSIPATRNSELPRCLPQNRHARIVRHDWEETFRRDKSWHAGGVLNKTCMGPAPFMQP